MPPHAIIVLNASENGIDEKLWDVPANTESILEDLNHTVNRNETFKKWAQFWRERNELIKLLTKPIPCYYSSVQVKMLFFGLHNIDSWVDRATDFAGISRRSSEAHAIAGRKMISRHSHCIYCCSLCEESSENVAGC